MILLRPFGLLLAAALAGTASTTAQVDPRTFAPRDHTSMLRVDMAAIADSRLWDLVERSPLRMLVEEFRDAYGFALADLDEIRLMAREDAPPEGAEPWRSRHEQVWVFRGRDRVGLARLGDDLRARYSDTVRAGGVDVHRTADGMHELASPRPGLVVGASVIDFAEAYAGERAAALVERTLAGRRGGGSPVPDLMALSASPRALALLAAVATEDVPLLGDNLQPLPREWLVAEDPPHGVRLQLVRAADGERLAVELLLRYGIGDGQGPRTFADGFEALRAELAAEPRLRAASELLADVATELDGRDLTLRLDLGDERELGRRLSSVVLALGPLLVLGSADAPPAPQGIAVPVGGAIELPGGEVEPEPVREDPRKKEPPR